MKIYYVGCLYENSSTDYSKFVANSSCESFDTRDLKRINLKTLGFTNDEIKEIVISLQLIGLDLNKKKY